MGKRHKETHGSRLGDKGGTITRFWETNRSLTNERPEEGTTILYQNPNFPLFFSMFSCMLFFSSLFRMF